MHTLKILLKKINKKKTEGKNQQLWSIFLVQVEKNMELQRHAPVFCWNNSKINTSQIKKNYKTLVYERSDFKTDSMIFAMISFFFFISHMLRRMNLVDLIKFFRAVSSDTFLRLVFPWTDERPSWSWSWNRIGSSPTIGGHLLFAVTTLMRWSNVRNAACSLVHRPYCLVWFGLVFQRARKETKQRKGTDINILYVSQRGMFYFFSCFVFVWFRVSYAIK